MPTFRHPARALESVRLARERLAGLLGGSFEIVLVDDGSPPGERIRAADLPADVVFVEHRRNRGKGAAVRSGVERTLGERILITDADLPFGLEPVETTLAWLDDGADLVLGDRTHPESDSAARVSPLRRLSSRVFTFLVNRVVRLPLGDTQCGYKGYRGPVARRLFAALGTDGFAFDVEILLRARNAGYELRRQPLRLVDDEVTTVRLWRHAPGIFFDTLRLAWRQARGRLG